MSTVVIGGVEYAPLDASGHTVEYDWYMGRVLDASGLTALLHQQAEGIKVAPSAVMDTLMASRQFGALLAGLLKPVDVPWTAEWAKNTAIRINGGLPAKDRGLLGTILNEGLALFFPAGPRSLVISPSS